MLEAMQKQYSSSLQMKSALLTISLFLTATGLVVSFVFFKSLNLEYSYGENPILLQESGQVGDFIGGVVGTIFSLAGFTILLLTLSAQSKSTYLGQLESRFFELIRLHRENITEMEIVRRVRDSKNQLHLVEFKGRKAIKVILSDFITCRNELRSYFSKFTAEEIYEAEYLEEVSIFLKVNTAHIRIKSIAKINIAYCIVFYGIGNEGKNILSKVFHGKYKTSFYEGILEYLQMKPVESSDYWHKWKDLKKIKKMSARLTIINEVRQLRTSKLEETKKQNVYYYDNDYIKFYGGHQYRLGHYYRHLFQSVKYINSQKRIRQHEKYSYIKSLRAQLSTYEQALLFANSLSFMGLPWEFKPDFKLSQFEFINKKRRQKARLITIYNLIKNLPGEDILGIDYKHYYPDVKYELDE